MEVGGIATVELELRFSKYSKWAGRELRKQRLEHVISRVFPFGHKRPC